MSELKPCPIDIMKIRKLCYDGALRAYIEDEYIYLKDTVSGEVVRIGDAPARRAQPDNEPMTCEGCQCQKREGWNYESCMRCKRHWPDRYHRKPEPEGSEG